MVKPIAKLLKILYTNAMSEFFGIYGGAFDPPHKAHIETAKALIKERGYDKLIFLPSHNPPHKSLSASDNARIEMLQIFDNDKFIVSDIEIKHQGVGYTVEYLPEIIAKYGDNIEYIIGGDSLLNFDNWYKPLELLKLTKILVVARDKDMQAIEQKLLQYKNQPKKGIEIAKFMPPSMSSSEIRDRLRLHLPVDKFLDEQIVTYIKNHNLYSEYDSLLEKVTDSLSEDRLMHTKGVVLFALKYAKKLNLDYNKVFLAALLHDIAKNQINYDYMFEHNLVPNDSKNTPVAHAFCGAVVAKNEFGIDDEEVLDAIYCHTTAKPNMSKLAKLVYCADMLEMGRDFDGVQKLRDIFDIDFEKGFFACLEATVNHLKSENKDIYPLTLQAYEFYQNIQK